VPIATLRLNNPQAVHPQDWLYEGERLFIPETSATPPATHGGWRYWYLKGGDMGFRLGPPAPQAPGLQSVASQLTAGSSSGSGLDTGAWA
jgi:hypothetical protein